MIQIYGKTYTAATTTATTPTSPIFVEIDYTKEHEPIKCNFDMLSDEERSKPMGLVCFCPKCSVR